MRVDLTPCSEESIAVNAGIIRHEMSMVHLNGNVLTRTGYLPRKDVSALTCIVTCQKVADALDMVCAWPSSPDPEEG